MGVSCCQAAGGNTFREGALHAGESGIRECRFHTAVMPNISSVACEPTTSAEFLILRQSAIVDIKVDESLSEGISRVQHCGASLAVPCEAGYFDGFDKTAKTDLQRVCEGNIVAVNGSPAKFSRELLEFDDALCGAPVRRVLVFQTRVGSSKFLRGAQFSQPGRVCFQFAAPYTALPHKFGPLWVSSVQDAPLSPAFNAQ